MVFEAVLTPIVASLGASLGLAGIFYLINWISPLHRARRAVLRESSLLACVKDEEIKDGWQAEIDEEAHFIRKYKTDEMGFYHLGMTLYFLCFVAIMISIIFGSVFSPGSETSITEVILLVVLGLVFVIAFGLVEMRPKFRQRSKKK